MNENDILFLCIEHIAVFREIYFFAVCFNDYLLQNIYCVSDHFRAELGKQVIIETILSAFRSRNIAPQQVIANVRTADFSKSFHHLDVDFISSEPALKICFVILTIQCTKYHQSTRAGAAHLTFAHSGAKACTEL